MTIPKQVNVLDTLLAIHHVQTTQVPLLARICDTCLLFLLREIQLPKHIRKWSVQIQKDRAQLNTRR